MVVCSEARLRANRRNSLRSTGPTTDAGKFKVSANALTHGVTARKHTPERFNEELQTRLAGLEEEFAPRTTTELIYVEQAAVSSVLLRHTQEQIQLQTAADALRASGCWDDDQRVEALKLAAKLPKDPERIAAQLRQTQQGAQWLLDKLTVLDETYKSTQSWDETQLRLAFHLLGMAAPDDPSDVQISPAVEELAELVTAERADLEALIDILTPTEVVRRSFAEGGIPIEPSPALQRLRRYEAMHARRLHTMLRSLQTEQREAAANALWSSAPSTPARSSPSSGANDCLQPATASQRSEPQVASTPRHTVNGASALESSEPSPPLEPSRFPRMSHDRIRNPRKRRELERLQRESHRRATARASSSQNKATCQNGSQPELVGSLAN